MHSHQQNILTAQDMLYKLQTPHEVINYSSVNEIGSDIVRDSQILRALEDDDSFAENQQIKEQKEDVVQELKNIVCDWVSQLHASSNKGESEVDEFLGELQVFGSFRTGADAKDGDIDTIVIAPIWIQRETHFFGSLANVLRTTPRVENLYCIPDAIVPLIKFKFKGIQIDMVFAQILSPAKVLSASLVMDDKSQRSLNGLRAADYFSQVYSENRKFKQVLRSIKLWANNRGIYGGVTGYLGGISWAILISKVLQMYPYYSISQLLDRFFFLYSQWRWGELPVVIEKEESQSESWKRLFQNDYLKNNSCMTILTPVFPAINSAHNVSPTTLKIIQEQFWRSFEISQRIKKYQDRTWGEIFKKLEFFDIYNQYLQIKCLASTTNELCAWKGHVESRLRKLNKLFEEPKYATYFEVHLFPKSFSETCENESKYKFSESFYYGIKPISHLINMDYGGRIDITNIIVYFADQLEGTQPFVTIPESLSLSIEMVQRKQINDNIKKQL